MIGRLAHSRLDCVAPGARRRAELAAMHEDGLLRDRLFRVAPEVWRTPKRFARPVHKMAAHMMQPWRALRSQVTGTPETIPRLTEFYRYFDMVEKRRAAAANARRIETLEV